MDKPHCSRMSMHIICALLLLAMYLCDSAQRISAQPIIYVDRQPTAVTTAYVPTEADIVVEPVVVEPVEEWYVTEDEQVDRRGNAFTILNFLRMRMDDEVQWIKDNYVDGWPFGPLTNDEAFEISDTVAVAIVANCWDESSCGPDTLQGGSLSGSAQQALSQLEGLGSTGGHAYGIIQWDGGRRSNFVQFCKASGFDPRSLEVQLHYLAYEAYVSSERSNYDSVLRNHNSLPYTVANVQRTAEVYRARVERGGTPYRSNAVIANWSNKWSSTWGPKPDGGWFAYAMSR